MDLPHNIPEKQATGRFSPETSYFLGVRTSWEIFSWDFIDFPGEG
jgi:hypothetical protein